MKKISLIIISVVIASTVYLVFSKLYLTEVDYSGFGDDVQKLSPAEYAMEKKGIPDDWETLVNNNYTFRYPSEAESEIRDVESVVHYMGEKQRASGRTQTELFDGYAFSIRDITDEVEESAEATAKFERGNAVAGCEQDEGFVSELQTVEVGGQRAYQFYSTNCYIDYTQTIVSDGERVYRIVQSYVGEPEDYPSYKETTEILVSSLEFKN